MRKFEIKGLTATVLATVLVAGSFSPSVAANPADGVNVAAESAATATSVSNNSYKEYIAELDAENAKEDIKLGAESAVPSSTDITVRDGVGGKTALVWQNGTGEAVWNITVPQSAYYNIKISYMALKTGVDYGFGIKIDGEYPFEEAKELIFSRMWKDSVEEFKTDDNGNQLTPEQVEPDAYFENFAKDDIGIVTEPYLFYFSEGTHTVSLVGAGQEVAVSDITVAAPENLLTYSELSKTYSDKGDTDAQSIIIEAEKADIKTSSKLIPRADNSDAGMSPQSVASTSLNYIGGTTWQTVGQTLIWSFDVEKSGYYSLGFRYRQSDVINAESWRKLKIDGKTPFEEANGIRFPYCASWSFYEFGDGKENYRIWLEKGEHTLSLEVTLGDMAEYYDRLSQIVEVLSDKYIDIVKITGATPDINLDYELFSQISDLESVFKDCKDKLELLAEDMKSFTGKRGNQYVAAMNNMTRVIKNMLKNPYIAHQYVSDYYSNYSSLSSWLYDMKNMPLYLDTIQIVPSGGEFTGVKTSVLKKAAHTVKRLLISFVGDYIKSNKADEDSALTLWVNWGTDQATSLDTLIRDSFTDKTGIPVNVKITNASLINGLLSGNFPDMVLQMARTEPVNLGIRGALVDLYEMPDIDQVLTRFQEGAEEPYSYDGKLYALPDSQNFQLMYYRTDIFESLGLSVPETWDEFLYTASIIQRNNMDVYIPYTMITASTTINSGIGSLNLYATLMGQNGLSLYNEQLNATAIDSVEAINVFDYWTDLYTKYDLQKESDFYNRFRVGVMPLGIANYSTYNTLYSAAPEIKGRWAVACVPGVKGGNNSVAGAGTGCAVIKKSDKREKAWEFLKWWTSAEAQTRYSNNVESLLGMLGRPQTSNVEALNSLAWDKSDLKILNEQWSRVREVPEIPGSYYVGRAIDQAFWSVMNDGTNAMDAISKWSETADAEITRKIKEYF